MDRVYGTGPNYLDVNGGIGEIKINFKFLGVLKFRKFIYKILEIFKKPLQNPTIF